MASSHAPYTRRQLKAKPDRIVFVYLFWEVRRFRFLRVNLSAYSVLCYWLPFLVFLILEPEEILRPDHTGIIAGYRGHLCIIAELWPNSQQGCVATQLTAVSELVTVTMTIRVGNL